jgi:hypothetical protein
MMRRRVAWLLALPVAAAGLSGGHELAWRIAVPDGAARARELAQSGNGYAEHLPLVLGLCIAAFLLAFALRAHAAFRGTACAGAPAKTLALLPPLAFLLREQMERIGHGGDLFPGVFADRTFLVGFAVQIPLGLILLLLTRMLDALATSVGEVLAAARTRPVLRMLELSFTRQGRTPPRIPVLARGYGERAPPSLR